MKSQSLEVLSEIRKTLSVLSIQIEKLSAALEELEGAEETAVPDAGESEVEADSGVSSEPETLSQEGSQAVAEVEEAFGFEPAAAVLESEESLEVAEAEEIAIVDDSEASLEAAEAESIVAAVNAEAPLEVTEAPFEEAVSLQEIEDLPEVEAVGFPQESVSTETTDESLSSEASESPEASDDLPHEIVSLESSDDFPQEPVDLSQDIEEEMSLPDVHGFQWMIDIPGSKVANVISAISLNDRVLLINTLFKENPELFQQTISKFNNMESLSEAISYVLVTFPEWNLNSDVVYRLMMAVRRRLG